MTTKAEQQLAIHGGEPIRTLALPERPTVRAARDRDPRAALERELAGILEIDAGTVLAVSDYDVAGSLALAALGISSGEVVVPALGATRLTSMLQHQGLSPIPAEVEPDTANLGPRGLRNAIGERTCLVAAGHAFGHPLAQTDIERVMEPLALPLLEDASASLGASYRGRPTGTLGSAAIFDFGRSHVLTGGGHEGCLLVVRDPGAAAMARAARDDGGQTVDERAARVALAELRGAAEELSARRQLAWELTFSLRARRGVSPMAHSRWVRHAYDRYLVRIRGLLWKRSLADTVSALRAEGIDCAPAFQRSLHNDPVVSATLGDADPRLAPSGFPVATRLPGEAIALPLHQAMTDLEIQDIALALAKLEAVSTGAPS